MTVILLQYTCLTTVRIAVACCSASDYRLATRSKLTNSFAFTSKCTCGSIKTVFIDFCYGLISLKLMGATDKINKGLNYFFKNGLFAVYYPLSNKLCKISISIFDV